MPSSNQRSILIFSILTTAVLAAAAALALWNGGEALPAAAPAAVPASGGDWGLSFSTEGQAPSGNASPAELKKYDAYYLGDTSQKVIYLTFDHFGLLAEVDRILDRLEGTSMALLDQERPHEVRWLHPETGAARSFRIGGERDWTACLAAILSDPAPMRGRSILEQSLSREAGGAIYQIHVTGKEVPHEEA